MDECFLEFSNDPTTLYWAVETKYQGDISEFLNENEIDAKRYDIRGIIVYLLTSGEDYFVLNSFLKLMQ